MTGQSAGGRASLPPPALGGLAGGGKVVLRSQLGDSRVDRVVRRSPLDQLRPQPRPAFAGALLPGLDEHPRRRPVVEIPLLRQPRERRLDLLLRIAALPQLDLQLTPEVG